MSAMVRKDGGLRDGGRGSTMDDTLSRVVVPYADFLARSERRGRIVAELEQPAVPPPVDPEDQPLAVAVDVRPVSGEQK
jgi:hypothetical protein